MPVRTALLLVALCILPAACSHSAKLAPGVTAESLPADAAIVLVPPTVTVENFVGTKAEKKRRQAELADAIESKLAKTCA